ncbi:MAG TPA: T9SS type A sorting domain-containing protein, partial [Ferruginibacter sp.]|nr:T9SS type A sorting domain-containing protein [Ferruginibacter sp.]
EGYPSYNVKWSQVGSTGVRIQMNQVTSHTSVAFFQLPVALKFKNATQEKTVVVDNKFNGEVYTRNIGFIADTVLVDPEYWLITRNNTTSKIPYTSSGQGSVDFPNPVTDTWNLYFHDFNEPSVAFSIYNAAGQLVYSREVALFNGAELVDISTRSWARGIYIIKIAGSTKIVKRVLK